MRAEGFFPCKAEPDIWMRPAGDHYEYVAVYVDDLAFAVDNPQQFVDNLCNKHNFNLKGTGPISYHLGANFSRDKDGILCMSPKKYITERLASSYLTMFGEKPRTKCKSPLEKGDHPETDISDLLDINGIQQYQSLIGSLQWTVTLGRYDVMCAIMTMSSFRAAPRIGHLERLKRICGYLINTSDYKLRFRTHPIDYSDVPEKEYDWFQIYGDVKEMLPADCPKPLGKSVILTHYVDANLMHDITTGRSVTACLHFINGTPIDAYSKKQPTVETATYGSEFVAARTCVEQIIDLRTTLRYLGVNTNTKSYMFGDNESVVNSSTTLYAKLTKRHNLLSFHRVREAIASGFVNFIYLPGKKNPADVLSKHWSFDDVRSILLPIMHYYGDPPQMVEN